MVYNIYSFTCTQHSCPTTPTRFFRSLNELTLHDARHHPPPPIHSPSTTDQPPPTPTNTLDIGASIIYTQRARMGRTTCGTSASSSSYKKPITTHPISETHGADTSNTATFRTFSAYKHTPFKQSPTHIHFPLTPPPSGGYSFSTLTCWSSLPPLPLNAPTHLSMPPSGIASIPSTPATSNMSTTWLCHADNTH